MRPSTTPLDTSPTAAAAKIFTFIHTHTDAPEKPLYAAIKTPQSHVPCGRVNRRRHMMHRHEHEHGRRRAHFIYHITDTLRHAAGDIFDVPPRTTSSTTSSSCGCPFASRFMHARQ